MARHDAALAGPAVGLHGAGGLARRDGRRHAADADVRPAAPTRRQRR